MAHPIRYFTETELNDMLRSAKEVDGNVTIEWRRFPQLIRSFLDSEMIRQNLKESGVDFRFEAGGIAHAVSRLLGVQLALQRMSEGGGVVPGELLTDAHKKFEQLAEKFTVLQDLHEAWVDWARKHNHLFPGAAPRTDGSLRSGIDEKLERGSR